jgi:hypothetical protein
MSRPAPDAALPDLTGLRLLHRVMRTDLHRLTALAEQLAHLRAGISGKRAKAIDRWVLGVCAEIHHHHEAEDVVAGPVITEHAGTAVDLTGLSDDHAALDPLLDEVRAASAALVARLAGRAPAARRAAGGGSSPAPGRARRAHRRRGGGDLPGDREVRAGGRVGRRHEGVQKRKGGPSPVFQVPRIADAATPDEMTVLRAEAGPVLMMLLAAMRPGHRPREALVVGN